MELGEALKMLFRERMKRRQGGWHRIIFLNFAIVLVCAAALRSEQKSDMESVGKHIGKHISEAGFSSTAVADFVREDGTPLAEGRYFSQELTQSLKRYHPKILVVGPWDLLVALADAQVSPLELLHTENPQKISSVVHVDTIISGKVETAPDHYRVKVTARNLKDGSVVSTEDQFVKRPSYTDEQMFLDPTATARRIDATGDRGLTAPACVECTVPAFGAGENSPKHEAEVEMDVLISEEGQVLKAVVLRATDAGLKGKALEVVRTWRFRPATDKNRKPIAVIVPVTITFRIY
jgi:TonB family protein